MTTKSILGMTWCDIPLITIKSTKQECQKSFLAIGQASESTVMLWLRCLDADDITHLCRMNAIFRANTESQIKELLHYSRRAAVNLGLPVERA